MHNRHRGDSNPCGQSPMDFESISLATRTQCHACSCLSGGQGWAGVIEPASRGSEASAHARPRRAACDGKRRQRPLGAKSDGQREVGVFSEKGVRSARAKTCVEHAGVKSDGQREMCVFSGKTSGRRARRRAFRSVFVEDVTLGRKEVYQFCFFCQQRLPQDDCARQRT
jgi:hypothetical protein